MKNIPIALFVYNRPIHTRKVLEAVVKNYDFKSYPMFIFADGPKDISDKNYQDVQKIINEYRRRFPNIKVILSNKNKGLANAIIYGVTEVLKKYKSIIVMEDDLVVSKYFLRYMEKGLLFYQDNKKVGEISGYSFSAKTMHIPYNYSGDVYFSLRPSSWGWATWKDRWDAIDWKIENFSRFRWNFFEQMRFNKGGGDLTQMLIAQKSKKINSWAIRWAYNFFKRGWLTVYPTISFVDNIGNDNSGIHSKASNYDLYANPILNSKEDIIFPEEVLINKNILRNFRKVYSRNLKYYFRKFFYKITNKNK